jgi:hypothetical protein
MGVSDATDQLLSSADLFLLDDRQAVILESICMFTSCTYDCSSFNDSQECLRLNLARFRV